MGRTPFNQQISPEAKELFDELSEMLPANKGQILEAAIESFYQLPEEAQLKILSARPETREVILGMLSTIGAPQEGTKPPQRAKIPKSRK